MLQDFSNQHLAPRKQSPWRFVFYAAIVLFAIALYPISRTNYLLFHNIVELTSIAVAATLFSIGWNTRQITRNDSFLLLAIAFLAIAGLDLLHTLTYKGMGVFPNAGVDPPTQLWVAARALEAFSYMGAACLIGRSGKLRAWPTLFLFAGIATLLTLCIWPWGIFPVCLVEGQGLTGFKIAAEYVICTLLLVSGLLFWKGREQFDPQLMLLLLLSIGLTIFSEIAFTLYRDVYGISNVLGHFLKLASVIMVYRALVLGSLKTPYRTLFRDLAQSHEALDRELAQRRLTEEQLRAANQELDAFVRTASHDLRAPLTVIIGGAELLQTYVADQLSSDHLKVLNNIEGQGHRMAKLLKDLLNLAQVGHLGLPPETVYPSRVAEQAVEDLMEEVVVNNCPVVVEEIPAIQAHPTLIYLLLTNLIANAVRYGSNPEQSVVVGGQKQNNTLHLFVRDHGEGIPEKEREQIFKVFYRVDGKPSRGTGIGLATVQKIAQHYSGRAYVEETPGGGATFRVELEERKPPTNE